MAKHAIKPTDDEDRDDVSPERDVQDDEDTGGADPAAIAAVAKQVAANLKPVLDNLDGKVSAIAEALAAQQLRQELADAKARVAELERAAKPLITQDMASEPGGGLDARWWRSQGR